MQLRNGKCYISEVTAWWNANKAKTANVQTIMMAVAMNWMSQEELRRLMWSSYARHLAEVKKAEEAEEEEEECGQCGLCDGNLDCPYGNNPAPLKTNGRNDVCCDSCNITKVIPARRAAWEQTADETSEDEDEDEDEDEFECPECCCVLKGDAANDERTWIALKCDCGDGDENCANCGYDVCMECEDAVMARETAEGNARE
jgi:hypothetical protein